MKARIGWTRELPWVLSLALAVLALGPLHPEVARSTYAADRTLVANSTEIGLYRQGYQEMALGPVRVYYLTGDGPQAKAVASDAAWALPRVASVLGLPAPSQTVVVVERSEGALRRALGWSGAEDALGVYWNGVVRVLSPALEELPGPPATLAARYRHNGPVAHELAHYVLDVAADGNYPSWYTEGLAQYADYRLTGYALEPAGLTPFGPPYGLPELEKSFYTLPDTDAAYAEAFRMMLVLAQTGGPRAIPALDRALARGVPFAQAMREADGLTPAALFARTFGASG